MDFSPYLVGLTDADCCVFWHMGTFVGPFLTQYHDYGVKMPLFIPIGASVAHEITLAEVGDSCLGTIASDRYTPLLDTDINRRFVDAFVKKYGKNPRSESLGGYVATTTFLEAVKATGGDTSPEAIINALRELKVDTPAGTYSFTPEGLGIGDMYILKAVKIGDRYTWEVIYKYSQIILDEPK